ncbi:MAG: hypothetical protein JNL50_09485 [Phycisphaerae bacterium]|nr:hypothetical protein [Phycisphaerae bacterium]
MRCSNTGSAAAVALLVACAGSARAQLATAVFTKHPNHPTSVVPGARDLAGQLVFTRFRSIDSFSLSPDGSTWVMGGLTQQGADQESILIVGPLPLPTALAQEGQPLPQGGISETYDLIGRGNFNRRNRYAFTTTTRIGPNGGLYAVMYWDGFGFSITHRQGDILHDFVDIPPPNAGDELIGTFMDSAHPLDNDVVGVHLESIVNIDPALESALIYDHNAFRQGGVSPVLSLDASTNETWDRWTERGFFTTADGAHWLANGKIIADNNFDEVLAIDSRVVIQQGVEMPGTGEVPDGIDYAAMNQGGDWIAHGLLTDGVSSYANFNGAIVARTGAPILPSGGVWSTPFSAVAVSGLGEWLVAGKAVGPAASDDVIVHSELGVVMREGDPVDLNADGLANDDAFIGRGNPALPAFALDELELSNGRVLYVIANLRNGAGQDINSSPVFGEPRALVKLELPPNCAGDFNRDGFVNGNDYDAFASAFDAADPAADFNADGFVNGNDYDEFADAFDAGC